MTKYDDASWHYGGDFPEGHHDQRAGLAAGPCVDRPGVLP